MSNNQNIKPNIIFIIGAGRSGTNLISKMLENSGGFTDLSENRYIWNYCQKDIKIDRRLPHEATERVKAYIHNHFKNISKTNANILIDKTPGNALRLGFINKIFPEAKIINIVRDGRANVFSRSSLWDEESLLKGKDRPGMLTRYYRRLLLMRKKGNLPNDRIPIFLLDNIPNLINRVIFGFKTLSGERIAGLHQIEQSHGRLIARAVQWREVATIASIEGKLLGNKKYHEILYEDLLTNPEKNVESLFKFLNHSGASIATKYLLKTLDFDRLKNWKNNDPNKINEIYPYISTALEYFGYESSSHYEKEIVFKDQK